MPKNKKTKMKTNNSNLKSYTRSFFISLAILLIVSIVVLAGIGFGVITAYINAIPNDALDKIVDSSLLNQTTTIYDSEGKEVAKLHGAENRIKVPYSKMPKNLINAFVSIEDERFWEHNGIDLKRIFGAIFKNIKNKSLSEGASTITQQLVRNKLLTFEKSFKRKIQEQYLAIQLEKRLSKEQILEEYLNTINLGHSAYGVQAAAYTYFGKDVSELNLAECALIAGITQNPSYFDPYVFFDHAKEKQEIVLKKMLDLGYINEQEYLEAKDYKLTLVQKDYRANSNYNHQYYVDSVIDEAVNILVEKKGITKSEAEDLIYSSGLKIYTAMDEKVQQNMEDVFSSKEYMPPVRFIDKNGLSQPQAAAVMIDVKTGAVVGIMGGRSDIKGSRLFNRATMSIRQPGSSIKPIADYALALENGYTAASIIDDVPFTIGGYSPKNWYKSKVVPGKRGYKGFLTVREALQWSANVPAVKIAYNLGVENVYRNLKRFGFTTLSNSDQHSLSIAIGGFTYGVKPIELTAAFSAVANRGIYTKPYFIEKIEDKNGVTIYELKKTSRNVMDERNAYILTDILSSVVKAGITVSYKFKYPVAGKTGTTDDSKDRWFVGFTPKYSLGVWVGEDHPRALTYLTGVNPALKIFKGIMDKSMDGVITEGFTKPSGIVEKYICLDSGKLATELCKKDPRGNRVVKEIFVAGTEPTEYCDVHVTATICTESKALANEFCPQTITKVFIQRANPIWPDKEGKVVPPDDYMYQLPKNTCTIHTAPSTQTQENTTTNQTYQTDTSNQSISSNNNQSQDQNYDSSVIEQDTTSNNTYR
ncbi:transglycosylase domain-containing protein [Caldicellulosiruptoraceae bacterium PP1]